MDTRGFLESVVPWQKQEGYVTVHWQHRSGNGKFSGRSCRTVDDVLTAVEGLKARTEANIYFCLSRQQQGNGKRDRAHATALCSGWMDIDVDPTDPKKYPTVPIAIVALLRFCLQVGIPRPSIIVASGGGIHAYWLSDRVLTVEEWQPFVDALKAAALTAGLKFDAALTTDAVRILRVPNTTNWNYTDGPRQVRLIQPYCNGVRHDFKKIFVNLAVSATRPKIEIAPAFKELPKKNLGEGIDVVKVPPLPLEPILPECSWLREAHETGGKAFNEAQWHLTTLISTFLENGDELAHKFGNRHPGYSHATTETKLAYKHRQRANKNVGFPYCRTIHDAGSTHCKGCKHLAADRSPLNFAWDAVKSESESVPTEDEIEKAIHELGGSIPPEAELPKGFAHNKEGLVCAYIPSQVKPKRHAYLLQIMLSKIWNPSLQHQNGKFGLGFTVSTDLDGTQEVFLSGINTFTPGVYTALPEQFVMFVPGKEAHPYVEKFTVAWLDRLRKKHKALRDTGTLGWRWENSKRIGFVYGPFLYHEDGREVPIVTTSEDEFRGWYAPKGDSQVWLKACKLLTDRKRPELDIIICIGFAAPLMTFTGTLYGGILSVWGEPGTSKSTAQQVAAAIWGHPKQTRESLNSTPKSVQGRLGRTRNLAAYWDDIQDERHQDRMFDTMFVATEGAEGGRLNPDSTMKARLEWQTLLAACSNASFVEYLTKKQRSTTAGMRRVFEFEYNRNPDEPGMINKIAANQAFAELEHNYGGIGVAYAKLLVKEHKEIKILTDEITNRFSEKVNGTVEENYWWGMCGVLLTGATLANRLGAQFDIPAMEAFLEQAYLDNRRIRQGSETEGGTHANTEQALTAFINHYAPHIMITNMLYRNKSTAVSISRWPTPGRPIYVHVSHYDRKVIVSKRALREYLHHTGIDARQIFDGMTTFYKAREVKLTMGAGTALAQTQEWCFEITVPLEQYPIFEELLTAQGPAPADSTTSSASSPSQA